jgi:hypothetical protein
MLLHGDVAHRPVRRCAVPVLHACWNPRHITGAYHLRWFTPELHAADPFCNNDDLTARVAVPGSARAGGKGHDRGGNPANPAMSAVFMNPLIMASRAW